MKYEQFRKELKNSLPQSLYLLCGDEEYLRDYCCDEAKKIITAGSEDFDMKVYATAPDAEEVRAFAEALPLMNPRKLIILRKCSLFDKSLKNKDTWARFFADVPPACIVVISDDFPQRGSGELYKTVRERAVIVEFPLRERSELIKWLTNICASRGTRLYDADASYMIATLGREMVRLKSEIDKIIALCGENTSITRDMINSVIIAPVTDKIFNLIDAVFAGRRRECYAYLNELKKLSRDGVRVLSTLSGQILNVFRARLLLSDGLSAPQSEKMLGGGYGAKKAVEKASRMNKQNIEMLLSLCRDADRCVKQGLIDSWAAIELIIAEYKYY
ncbi:MAG: DNA polymerase III subunit delta [Clostridia bacterium]|nr:DNA polymerase III subunit delta [Clostridia bacterium]